MNDGYDIIREQYAEGWIIGILCCIATYHGVYLHAQI